MQLRTIKEMAGPDGGSTGRHRFVIQVGADAYQAIGYCAEDPANDGGPCPGHETEEGAARHYHDYRLDHELHLNQRMPRMQKPCRVCETYTDMTATLGGYFPIVLCERHQNRESVDKITTPAAKIWGD